MIGTIVELEVYVLTVDNHLEVSPIKMIVYCRFVPTVYEKIISLILLY
jgi:hypothetical protein